MIINLFPFSFVQNRPISIKNVIFIFHNGRKKKWGAKYFGAYNPNDILCWLLKKEIYLFSSIKKQWENYFTKKYHWDTSTNLSKYRIAFPQLHLTKFNN